MNNIILIAITGGPCGGKSTFMAKVFEWLQGYGIYPIIISETATELINAGINPSIIGMDAFEEIIIDYQIDREENYKKMAKKIAGKKDVVILCDRGIIDCAAYVDRKTFNSFVKSRGYVVRDLLNRYKLAIHLTTAAIGAEEFYTLENNVARRETLEEARAVDIRTQNAWLGHPHHLIIDNSTGFDEKMLRSLRSLARGLNMPIPTEIERKLRFKNFKKEFIPNEAVSTKIVQDYLVSAGETERRVRSMETDGEITYFYTEKEKTKEIGKRYEREVLIPEKRYYEYLTEKDKTLSTIKKTRYCFVFLGKRFELDVYESPESLKNLVVLEVELISMDEKVSFPDGWELEEVTGNSEFDNKYLSSNH